MNCRVRASCERAGLTSLSPQDREHENAEMTPSLHARYLQLGTAEARRTRQRYD